ncbi:MAG: hypothetical protein ABIK56_01505 [candidate division WOR-3 bacterium]
MNGNNKKLKLIVRRLKNNPPIIISCDIKPVEIYNYKSSLTAWYVFLENIMRLYKRT